MKHSTAVALIVEAHRQGHAQADSSYRSLLEKVNHSATIEALQAEVERLNAQLGNVSNLEKAFEIRGVHICDLSDEIERLKAENARLAEQPAGQYPKGMENCTILFKQCAVGHAWLTATNWVQHECPTCERNAKDTKIEELRAMLKAARQKRIDRVKLADELCKDDEEECRLAELGRLVEQMPPNSFLSNDTTADRSRGWRAKIGGNDFEVRNTPAEALIAANVGQEEE